MDILEEHLIELALLLIRKAKIEEKLRQTFKCFLRKCFSCCGMKNIELELKYLNETIAELKGVEGLRRPSIMDYAVKLESPVVRTSLV